MKKGKFITIGTYNNVRLGYGTVDFKNLKTIYVQLSSWTQPTEKNSEVDKLISRKRKNIKDTIYILNSELFKKESIVDLDIKTKGIKSSKRSFMDLEITLFVNKQFDIRSKEIKEFVYNLSKNIIDTILIDDSLFNFFEKKN
jgi:hypothetical protein